MDVESSNSSFFVQDGKPIYYKLIQRIGQGGFGTVYLAEKKDDSEIRYAIKHVSFPIEQSNDIHGSLKMPDETKWQQLLKLKHDNLVQYFATKIIPSSTPLDPSVTFVIVMEYCSGKKPSPPFCIDRNSTNYHRRRSQKVYGK